MHALRESESQQEEKKSLLSVMHSSVRFLKIYLNGTVCINYMLKNNKPSVFKDEAGGSS